MNDEPEAGMQTAPVRWWDRPAGKGVEVALAALILAFPAYLLSDELRYSMLAGDDFSYIADSLDWSTTRAHLFEPHNTHIIPVFRLWTFLLITLSGTRANMPAVFRVGAYCGLIVTMLSVFLLIARETGRKSQALAAMAVLGISTVTQPAVTWYSAGQALWAGCAIVWTLLLAQNWSRKGGNWRLGLVALASLIAPAIWSGGLLAAPAAMAYLWAKDPSRYQKQLILLSVVTVTVALLLVILSREVMRTNIILWESHDDLWPRPIQAILHTFQAIAETLVFANLGLDAITTPMQSVALVCVLVGLWAWSRGGFNKINPLEASGGAVAVGSYLLVYFFRGNFAFSNLRSLVWYNAIPQVGAAVFTAGCWNALRKRPPRKLTYQMAVVVLGFVVLLDVLQEPRALRNLIQGAPKLTASESKHFLIPRLLRLRAIYFKEEQRNRQVRALARLDLANRVVGRMNAGPVMLRTVFGRVLLPGIPDIQRQSDVFCLLNLPPDDPKHPPDVPRLRQALYDLLRPEDEPRPSWLDPRERWPAE